MLTWIVGIFCSWLHTSRTCTIHSVVTESALTQQFESSHNILQKYRTVDRMN